VGNRRGTGAIDAVHEATTLEEMIAERVAQEATRIAEERIKVMFRVTEFDPDEVLGFMTSEEAASFLGLPYSSFREIAPSLPRHAITPARFGYLRRDLLAWGRNR
jgi:predicted Zn-dependent protease with MMP-like domain